MKLTYYKGKNFGDAINPLIFNTLYPNFFDNNDEVLFLGIGSILGLEKGSERTKKIIVFSSGYGAGDERNYSEKPVLDEKYNILCVRGFLTAANFGLDSSKAIIDGAVLITKVIPYDPTIPKKFKCSFILHHVSENMYENWLEVMRLAGIHYISPADPVEQVVEQIQQSEFLITEAMHGAILADVYRVPWIPVIVYKHINEFKWKDWLSVLNLEYQPVKLPSLFNKEHIKSLISLKTPFKNPNKNAVDIYYNYQEFFVRKRLLRRIKSITTSNYYLSQEMLLKKKTEQLFDELHRFMCNYKKE